MVSFLILLIRLFLHRATFHDECNDHDDQHRDVDAEDNWILQIGSYRDRVGNGERECDIHEPMDVSPRLVEFIPSDCRINTHDSACIGAHREYDPRLKHEPCHHDKEVYGAVDGDQGDPENSE